MEVIKPGQLVCSLAGRDKGNYYFVLRRDDKKLVWVVDGKRKTISEPKKKNELHLQKHNYICRAFAEQLDTGKLTDSSISYYLKEALKEKM